MALLDEELVEYWLNNQGFFCMRGVKTGLGEIDFLAIRPSENNIEAWHVEVQVSFRPIGYLGGNSNAKQRSEEEIVSGVDEWIGKKFANEKKQQKRAAILPNTKWRYVLVCAELRHPPEAELMKQSGIHVVAYRKIIDDLIEGNSAVNSTAGSIIEIIRYSQNDDQRR